MKRLILTSLALASLCAYAQQPQLNKGTIPLEAEGRITLPTEVRAAPPHGPFNLLIGKTLKNVETGSTVSIVGKKTYSGFSGTHVWYQVESTPDSPATQAVSGWIYGGIEGKDPDIQLEMK
ncbi:MAG: hypothetical protein KDK04_06965 [Candidatus Competibacteraceae bacterium]|nr:hypothetical protein [Caldilineaceae bacterium]MCB1811448.1 hypothetical protein [Candidatus Competibacteraceae bacterium]